MRAHRPQDYITKITAVAPSSDACPRWRQFLDEVAAGDQELVGYLQRVAGYALTGSTREHALFFLHGSGGNGKSKLVETLAGVLGDYHQEAPIATFTASNSDRHPTELAMLRGARLVTSSETEQGQHWAESKLKAITGGDLVVARFMRQDFFQYRPEFKLLIMGNHKPALRSVGPAMRRRFHLIPFTQHFDEERADPDLGEKLRTEWPGILQWAIEGCAKYLREGLVPPPVVLGATDEYLMSQDLVATWIDECCEQHYESQGLLKGLYGSFQCWCQAHGEPAASLRGLGAELEARGYRSKKVNRGKVILGLAVRSA